MGEGLMGMLIVGSGVGRVFLGRLVVNRGPLFGILVKGGMLVVVAGVGGEGREFEH